MTSRRLLTPAQKALLDAADYIEKNGHHKGAYYSSFSQEGSPACAVGALLVVTGYRNEPLDSVGTVRSEAAALLVEHINAKYHEGYIPDWNDADERTAEEVTAALRAAALSLTLTTAICEVK